jgi:hypothetical protein
MFSKMVQARSRVLYCGTTPIQRRATAGWATTSMPAMRTLPAVGRARVVQMLMVVVLPAPLGPSRAEEFALVHAEIDAVHGDDALLAVVYFLQTFNLYDHYGFIPWHSLDYMQRGNG